MTTDARKKAVERLARWVAGVYAAGSRATYADPSEEIMSDTEISAVEIGRSRILAMRILADLGLVAIDPVLVEAVRDADARLADDNAEAAATVRERGQTSFAPSTYSDAVGSEDVGVAQVDAADARLALADAVLAQVKPLAPLCPIRSPSGRGCGLAAGHDGSVHTDIAAGGPPFITWETDWPDKQPPK